MAQATPTGNTIDLSAFGQVWSEPWPGILKRNLQQWVSSALVINMCIWTVINSECCDRTYRWTSFDIMNNHLRFRNSELFIIIKSLNYFTSFNHIEPHFSGFSLSWTKWFPLGSIRRGPWLRQALDLPSVEICLRLGQSLEEAGAIFYVVGAFWTPKMATSIWNIRGISYILTVPSN